MINKENTLLTLAAWAILVSGVLHIAAITINHDPLNASALIAIAMIYVVIAIALSERRRWLSYLAYIVITLGMLAAYMMSSQSWVFGALALCEVVAWVTLFMLLWKNRSAMA